jgi:hypothetical protein
MTTSTPATNSRAAQRSTPLTPLLQRRPLTEEFTAVADSSGDITIAFTQGSADDPKVNGIEVLW